MCTVPIKVFKRLCGTINEKSRVVYVCHMSIILCNLQGTRARRTVRDLTCVKQHSSTLNELSNSNSSTLNSDEPEIVIV
jgi:hypothetical protein